MHPTSPAPSPATSVTDHSATVAAAKARRHRAVPGGFTLIELLTVIAIIALLMGILIPCILIAKRQSRRVQAKADITNITTAIQAYYNEYSKYPPLEATPSGVVPATDEFVGDASLKSGVKGNNDLLMNTLRGIAGGINADNQHNQRRVVFLEVKSTKSLTNPANGCLDQTPAVPGLVQGCYYDSWGKQYFVMIDSNADNVLDLDAVYTDITSANRPHAGVAVWSVGEDNKLGYTDPKTLTVTPALGKGSSKEADDIYSW